MKNTRHEALKILLAIIQKKQSLDIIQAKAYPDKDKAFIQALCYGVMRWYEKLQFISRCLVKKPIKQKDQDIHLLLLLGIYQLLYMRTKEYAAINETVNVAKRLKKPWAVGLLNATLRNFLQQKDEILQQVNANPLARFSHPKWLYDRIKSNWPEYAETIFENNNQHPPMSLRIDTHKITRQEYIELLNEHKMKAYPVSHSTTALILDTPVSVNHLPKFENGIVSVQDAGAQFSAPLLQLKPNLSVLDACAAPGGKTLQLLQSETNLRKLVAVDKDAARLAKVKENLSRANLHAHCIVADVTNTKSWWDGHAFDRILCDVLCSASGVIRRHPDIKFLRQACDIDAVIKTQQHILNALWPLLKPGGLLLFVTCSIFPEENTQQIEKFLLNQPDAKEQCICDDFGIKQKFGRQILPGMNHMDGFYYCLLEKKNVGCC